MASSWHYEKKPFQSWQLSNNNAEIRRLKGRIEELTRHKEAAYVGWEFEGGTVEINREANRLQIYFEGEAGCHCARRAEKQRFSLVAQGRGMAAAAKRYYYPRH